MNETLIDTAFTGDCLASIKFKLEKKPKKSNIFQKQRFPVVVRPKESVIAKNTHQFVNFTEESSTVPTSMVYSAGKDDVARPRNKFIIARSVLSKPVKSTYHGSTDDISRIISIVSEHIYQIKCFRDFTNIYNRYGTITPIVIFSATSNIYPS